MRVRHPLAAIFVVFLATLAPAATVQTVDDTTLTCNLTAFDGSLLTITVTGTGQSHPTTLPLADIARIVLKEPPPPPPPAPPTPTPDANGTTIINGPNGVTRVVRRPRKVATTAPVTQPATQPIATTLPATTAPSGPSGSSPDWRMKLVNGDALHGTLMSWADQHLIVRPDASPNSDITLAAAAVDWLWHGDAGAQAKALTMRVPRGADDVAFVRKEKDGEIVAVHGTAVGVDGDSLTFRYDGDDRKIKLIRLVGIVFAERKPVADTAFHQTVRLVDGEALSGHWKSLEGDTLTMETDTGTPVRFPLSSVAGIDFKNGRLAYVSDMTPVKVDQTPYFDRLIPYRTDVSLSGGPLKLSDGMYAKGLAVHSRCVLEYAIDGRFERFKTKLGFEPGAGAMGRAAVRVLADGKPLFENADVKGDDEPTAIDADVTGMSKLTLEVDFGLGQDVGDRVIWADARLLRAKVGAE